MKNLLFTLLGVLTLGCLMIFLPIGYSKKGKLVIFLLALLFATLGLVGSLVIPIWQMVLLIVVLISLSSYLLGKRVLFGLYQETAMDEREDQFDKEEEGIVTMEHARQKQVEPLKDLQEQPIPSVPSQITNETEQKTEQMQDEYLLDELQELSFVPIQEEIEVVTEDGGKDMSLVDEGHPSIEDQTVQAHPDIEALLEEMTEPEDDAELEEIIFKELSFAEVAADREEDDEATFEHQVEHTVVTDIEALIEDLPEEADLLDVIEEGSVVTDKKETPFPVEDDSNEEPATSQSEMEELLEEIIVEETPIEQTMDQATREVPLIKNEQTSALRHQLLQTMVEQLKLSQKEMTAGDFEQLLKEHLHEQLPLTDYYTFASLLIEHYILHHEKHKLSQFIHHLQGKYDNYPIINQELQYFYRTYC